MKRCSGIDLAAITGLFCLLSGLAPAQTCELDWDVSIGTPGFNLDVGALAVHDDGTGPALYAGGRFTMAGGQPANRVAKWNGASWSALGTGIGGGADDFASDVHAMVSFDDGNGPGLFVAGYFFRAGVNPSARSIAVWRNGAWSTLGRGVSSPDGGPGSVEALAVFDDGNGPALYAAGQFDLAGARVVNSIAKWDGDKWSSLGSGLTGNVTSLAVFDDGRGPALFAGGEFLDPLLGLPESMAKWTGRRWARVAGGTPKGEWIDWTPCPLAFCPVYIFPRADAFAVFDDGAGESLLFAGSMHRARSLILESPAQWTGSEWINMEGGGMSGRILTMATHTDEFGSALYAGGFDGVAGDTEVNGIACWDGAEWTALGKGVSVGPVMALASFDDGSGPALYVGGSINTAGGTATGNIARWKCRDEIAPLIAPRRGSIPSRASVR